jgi:hypothetical protein
MRCENSKSCQSLLMRPFRPAVPGGTRERAKTADLHILSVSGEAAGGLHEEILPEACLQKTISICNFDRTA